MERLTVFCVWVGDKYPAAYPVRLARGLRKHLSVPELEFVCITDREEPPEGWDRAEMARTLVGEEGCWPKLDLFRPREGWNLYVDLDCVILRSLDGILASAEANPATLHAMKDPARLGMNSSVMVWHGDSEAAALVAAADNRQPPGQRGKDTTGAARHGRWKGDQDFIWEATGKQHVTFCPYPDVVSYRLSGHRNSSAICVLHGRPKPADLDRANDPVAAAWFSA